MVVPLRDQNGRVRYYLGAQLDITELVNTCTGLESLRRLVDRQLLGADQNGQDDVKPCIDQMAEFQQLSETFTSSELQSLLKSQERQQLDDQVKEGMGSYQAQSARYKNSSLNLNSSIQFQGFGSAPPLGFYRNVSIHAFHIFTVAEKYSISSSVLIHPCEFSSPRQICAYRVYCNRP